MKLKRFLIFMLILPFAANAQREGGIWYFGDDYNLNLNIQPPVQARTSTRGFHAAAGVCDAAGNLRFYVKPNPKNEPMVFSTSGIPVANSNFLSDQGGNTNNGGSAIIIQKPSRNDQFYIFHSKSDGLFYSVLDMSLNLGQGGIIQKDVQITGFGSIVPGRIVAIKGCGGIWVVIRSQTANQYLSFLVSSSGVGHQPVVSEVGLMGSMFWSVAYRYGGASCFRASPDGRKLATFGSYGCGVELYDFEKCSGKLTNPRVIDTLYNIHPTQAGDRALHTGLAFSENSRFLYVAVNRIFSIDSVINGYVFQGRKGKVFQFDLDQGTTTAIINSKYLALDNPYVVYFDLFTGCSQVYKPELTDIKRGPDGKIYVYNNVSKQSCNPSLSPNYSTNAAWHVIEQPNNARMASQPRYNVIASAFAPSSSLFLTLPPDLVTGNTLVDTIAGASREVYACFMDTVELLLPVNAKCPKWFDGSTRNEKKVGKAGFYTVSYFTNECSYQTDTFKVKFVRLPKLVDGGYACPNNRTGIAYVYSKPTDSTLFNFRWTDLYGSMLRQSSGAASDTIKTLDTGISYLHITTSSGCDTIIKVYVRPLPNPSALIEYDTVVCKNIPITFTNVTPQTTSKWFLKNDEAGNTHSITRSFPTEGQHSVTLVVTNVEGCMDTAIRDVIVRDFKLDLQASPSHVNVGEEISLFTNASVSYQISAWEPHELFTDMSANVQRVNVFRETSFSSVGISEDGCIDTAYVNVSVSPKIYIPNAFTPNGDGKNDYFRVIGFGSELTVSAMHIYNRWGQLIFIGYNKQVERGWDGTYNGAPCEMGTYFYTFKIEFKDGTAKTSKGDFSLIR